jgi:hypothetical protein
VTRLGAFTALLEVVGEYAMAPLLGQVVEELWASCEESKELMVARLEVRLASGFRMAAEFDLTGLAGL